MAENLTIHPHATKEETYQSIVPQIEELLFGETNWTAKLANTAAVLKESLHFFWVGFYLVDSEDELVLGPFQGPVACTRIRKGKGVCGASWEREKPIIAPDVDEFPGHIACNDRAKSEIVLPMKREGKIIGVLDVDSDQPHDFDVVDQRYLEQIVDILTRT